MTLSAHLLLLAVSGFVGGWEQQPHTSHHRNCQSLTGNTNKHRGWMYAYVCVQHGVPVRHQPKQSVCVTSVFLSGLFLSERIKKKNDCGKTNPFVTIKKIFIRKCNIFITFCMSFLLCPSGQKPGTNQSGGRFAVTQKDMLLNST